MGAAFAILAAAPFAVDRIDGMGSLTRALEVDTPLLVLLTSSACADCRFLAMGFGEAAALAPRARFATVLEENDMSPRARRPTCLQSQQKPEPCRSGGAAATGRPRKRGDESRR